MSQTRDPTHTCAHTHLSRSVPSRTVPSLFLGNSLDSTSSKPFLSCPWLKGQQVPGTQRSPHHKGLAETLFLGLGEAFSGALFTGWTRILMEFILWPSAPLTPCLTVSPRERGPQEGQDTGARQKAQPHLHHPRPGLSEPQPLHLRTQARRRLKAWQEWRPRQGAEHSRIADRL